MIARVPDVAADTPLTVRRIPGLSVFPKNDYETHVAVHNVQAAVSAGNANNEDLRAAWLLYDKRNGVNVQLKEVEGKHVTSLGIPASSHWDLNIDRALVNASMQPDSPSNLALARSWDRFQNMRSHFLYTSEYGSREVLHHFLHVAVEYAQSCLDNSAQLRRLHQSDKGLPEIPYVGVIPRCVIPPVNATNGKQSYMFHGSLDFAIGMLRGNRNYNPPRGRCLVPFSKESLLSAVAVVDTLEELKDAHYRAMIEALTVLGLRFEKQEDDKVTIAVTNGILWRFYIAHLNKNNFLRVYELHANWDIEDDGGFIIEMLKDMMILPISPMITADFDAMSCNRV